MFPLRDTIRSRTFPVVNYLIIAVNVLVFVLESSMGPRRFELFISSFGMMPYRLLGHLSLAQLLTVFTSMFLHGGWFHVISNMWALYIFGDNIEDRVGHGRYLLFYLLCGVGAALAHIATDPSSTVPVVGASGAISGIMGAYIVLFPRSRIIALVPVLFLPWLIQIPAVVFVGIWFLSQLFNGLFSLADAAVGTYGGIAWWAHIGGFLVGFLLIKAFAKQQAYREFHPDEYWPW